MPRTKSQSRSSQLQPRSVPTNGAAEEILTLPEAAAYLRLPEEEVIGLVRTQGLPGRSVAGEWRFLKAAIQGWLTVTSSGWEARKKGILELAGKYKDDPDLEQIVEEALRRRGRPSTRKSSSK